MEDDKMENIEQKFENIIKCVKEMEKKKGINYYEENKQMFDLLEGNLAKALDIAVKNFNFFSEVMTFVEKTDEFLTPEKELKKWRKKQKRKNFLRKYPWGNMEDEDWHKHLFKVITDFTCL